MADQNEVIQIGSLPVPLPSSTPVTAEPKKAKASPEPAPAENFDIPDEAYLPEEAFDPPPDTIYMVVRTVDARLSRKSAHIKHCSRRS